MDSLSQIPITFGNFFDARGNMLNVTSNHSWHDVTENQGCDKCDGYYDDCNGLIGLYLFCRSLLHGPSIALHLFAGLI